MNQLAAYDGRSRGPINTSDAQVRAYHYRKEQSCSQKFGASFHPSQEPRFESYTRSKSARPRLDSSRPYCDARKDQVDALGRFPSEWWGKWGARSRKFTDGRPKEGRSRGRGTSGSRRVSRICGGKLRWLRWIGEGRPFRDDEMDAPVPTWRTA